MNIQKFTQKSLEAIQNAQNIAIENQNAQVEQEHILLALLEQENSLIKDLERRLEDKHIKLELTQATKEYLINNGYDEVYGARPLKRFVQKKLETLIAKKILAQEILPNTTVVIDCQNNELKIV